MEKTVKGLVSCVIPSYKRIDTLRRAIDSVLVQTYSNVEVLIVDDELLLRIRGGVLSNLDVLMIF